MALFYEELHNKRDKMSDEIENAASRATIDKWIFILFLVLMGVMPLIVLANVEQVVSPLVTNIDVLSSGTKGDLFTHFKALFVLVITVITGAMLLIKVYFMDGKIKKIWLNYVLGAFVVAIVASTVFSPNISIALNGQYNRSDGAISWLCYVALMFIAMNIEYPKKVVTYIMYTMIPFVLINLYIIMKSFYGKDLLQNNVWVQKLVSITLPEGSNISGGSYLVGTLNQWNYMSGMFAMMTVMYLAWAVTSKKWHENIIGAVIASASIGVMFMSLSTSGFLTFAVLSILIVLAVFRVEKKLQAIVAFALFVVVATPVFHVLANKDARVWTESFGFFVEKNPYIEEVVSLMSVENKVYASDTILELPVLPQRGISAGTGRFYIWDKTLNLIRERPLIGYGSDSLMYNFPHNNIDARAGIQDENTITDKPHNEYIGALFAFGIVGFVVLIFLVISIGIKCLIGMYKRQWSIFVLGIVTLAYFAQAMFNDSLPATSAWAFIIIGVVLSQYLKNKQEEHD